MNQYSASVARAYLFAHALLAAASPLPSASNASFSSRVYFESAGTSLTFGAYFLAIASRIDSGSAFRDASVPWCLYAAMISSRLAFYGRSSEMTPSSQDFGLQHRKPEQDALVVLGRVTPDGFEVLVPQALERVIPPLVVDTQLDAAFATASRTSAT